MSMPYHEERSSVGRLVIWLDTFYFYFQKQDRERFVRQYAEAVDRGWTGLAFWPYCQHLGRCECLRPEHMFGFNPTPGGASTVPQFWA